jgi:hypothetical protein
MLFETFISLATFTVPEQIGLNPQSLLWLLPLVASIAIVYKAIKVPKVLFSVFLKEVTSLFVSIIVFIAVTAVILFALAWLVTE